MSERIHRTEEHRDQTSPALFFVMVGLIVFFFAVFLVLKPRGPDAPVAARSAVHP